MKFEEIFKQEGMYVANSFAKGVAFVVEANSITGTKELKTKIYSDADDLTPHVSNTLVYAELFEKEYEQVFTRQELFKNK